MSIEDFKAGMEKFAKMFTNNHGLKLVFRGTQAKTNGKTIFVPELSLLSRPNMTDEEVDEALAFLMCTRGFVYHEGAHIIFTEDIPTIMREANAISPKFKHLFNQLEDLRIERSISDVFQGAREALAFMNTWLTEEVISNVKKLKPPATLKPFAQTCYAVYIVGQYRDPNECELWSLLNEKTREFGLSIRALVARARNADSTRLCFRIAKKIWEMLEKEEERRKEEKAEKAKEHDDAEDKDEDGEPDVGSSGEDDEVDDDTGNGSDDESGPDDGEEDADAGDDDDGTSSGGGGESEDEGEEETSDGDDAGDGADTEGDEGTGRSDEGELDEDEKLTSEDEDDAPEGKEELIGGHAKRASKLMLESGDRTYRVFTTENDVIGPPPKPDSAEQLREFRQMVRKIEADTRAAYGPVKRQFERLLQSRTRTFRRRGLDSGDLDPGALHRLALAKHGNEQLQRQAQRVFHRDVIASSLQDTVCELSIDISGSMAACDYTAPDPEPRVSLAQKCAVVFASGLDSVHIPFGISAWTTAAPGVVKQVMDTLTEKEKEEALNLYTRFGGLHIIDLKNYNEKWSQVMWRLVYVQPRMCNYDGESILFAAKRLMQRSERRKILFVMCDGEPGPCGEELYRTELFAQHLKDVVAWIRKHTPIELIGIGIDAPQVGEFYNPQFVNVRNIHELPTVVIKQLKKVLLT